MYVSTSTEVIVEREPEAREEEQVSFEEPQAEFEVASPAPAFEGSRSYGPSQVDEIDRVRSFTTPKLKGAREKVAARLAQKESVKGRALLDAIDAELRIRARLETMPKASPEPEEEGLPPLA